MQNASAWRSEAAEPFATPPAALARYTPHDLLAMLWRERGLMLGVFLALAALGLVAALSMKTSYQAHSSLLVRLSPEYVYNPRVGDAARGLAPESDSVVESEAEILASAGLEGAGARRHRPASPLSQGGPRLCRGQPGQASRTWRRPPSRP